MRYSIGNLTFNFRMRRENGLTFIELILTVVLISILSYIAIAKISGSSEAIKEKTFAKKVINDIRYAQEMALSNRKSVRFIVDPTQNLYSLQWSQGGYLQTPMALEDFIVDVDNGYYTSVSITSTEFTNGIIEFNAEAQPIDNGLPLAVEKTVLVINGSVTIKIVPGTGRCDIQE